MNKLQRYVNSLDTDRAYRAHFNDAVEAYELLNRYVFDNGLDQPGLRIRKLRGAWGWCLGDYIDSDPVVEYIDLAVRWPNKRLFVETLVHEMVHQFQWEVLNPERETQGLPPVMSHGPSFFAWRPAVESYGLTLRREYYA